MTIEPLKCKVCNGNLDTNLKCPYCGAQHEKTINDSGLSILSLLKVCPKHLIAYTDHYANLLGCPICIQEHRDKIEKERLDTIEIAKYRKKLEEEEKQRIAEENQRIAEWKKINYPKIKKLIIITSIILIIGIPCLSIYQTYYQPKIAPKIIATPTITQTPTPTSTTTPTTTPTSTPKYTYTPKSTPTPTQIPTFTPSIYSSITILNESGLALSVQYAPYSPSVYDRQGYGGTGLLGCLNINVNISDNVRYSIFFANTTFTGSTYPNTNSLWSGVVAYNNALITLDSFIVSDTYLIVITTNIQSETPSVSYVGMAYFTLNYIPTVISSR